ncbi:MAG: carbohydrate kinase family protein, partial [Phycisphaerae bacterium]
FLEGVVSAEGVDTSRLVKVPDVRTSLAFIASRSDGTKDITFYRNPGADMCLHPDHVDERWIASAEVLHFGSISLIDQGPAEATFKAHLAAQEAGCLVSYDPNWRPTLWPDVHGARETILAALGGTHVAKVSDEEWAFVTGTEDFHSGARMLLEKGPELVVRSEGDRGASFMTAGCFGHVRGFAVDCVEPTGAGDGFTACLIAQLLPAWREGVRPGQFSQADLMRIVGRANAVGALACTKVGAIPSLPTAAEVQQFLARR